VCACLQIEKVTKKMSVLYTGQLKEAAMSMLKNVFTGLRLDAIKGCLRNWAENHDAWLVEMTRHKLKEAALTMLSNLFKDMFHNAVKGCLRNWAEAHDEWRVSQAVKKHSISLLRVLHHFELGLENRKRVKVRLLGHWHRQTSKWQHLHIKGMLDEAQSEHKDKLALIKENKIMKEEFERVTRQVAKCKAQVEELEKQLAEASGKVKVVHDDGDNPKEVAAALEALEVEVQLRLQAEAELGAIKQAVLQHTETLKKAANDDEAMRSEMTLELQHLRDEIMSREDQIIRLREELHHRNHQPHMQALASERDNLYHELVDIKDYMQRNVARHDQGSATLKLAALEAELAESQAKCEALSASLRQTRREVSNGDENMRSEMSRLNSELVSRDSVIARLHEEMVRFELVRLRTEPPAPPVLRGY